MEVGVDGRPVKRPKEMGGACMGKEGGGRMVQYAKSPKIEGKKKLSKNIWFKIFREAKVEEKKNFRMGRKRNGKNV